MKTYNDDNRLKISFRLNDELLQKQVKPRQLLSDFLRFDCGMTGTHVGCEHGICGACTILFNDEPVRSCLMLAPQIDNGEITTIEGISKNDILNEIQQSFKEFNAAQCGYCTSGIIVSLTELFNKKETPGRKEIIESLSGQLCRCGSHASVFKAINNVIKLRRNNG